ncbi:MAG: SDR family NAD(P)-dependent oxidoreductase [Bryobacteraceae bacterium]
MKLHNRGILITGGSQGLGRAIAQACLREGAHILICGRAREPLEKTQAELAAEAYVGQIVLAAAADVSQPGDVGRLFEAAREFPSLDGVVNNAAVLGPQGPIEEADWETWLQTFAVNLFGSVLVCREALRVFRAQGRGKIVNLSGGGATGPRPRYSAYGASKAALVRLTETLAEEVKGTRIAVNAVAPGAMNTRMLDQVVAAGPQAAGAIEYERALKQQQTGGTPLEKAAALCVFLLSDASDGVTGRLLSAVWDAWEQLPARLAELDNTDVYTLRRIVPSDRGLQWD